MSVVLQGYCGSQRPVLDVPVDEDVPVNEATGPPRCPVNWCRVVLARADLAARGKLNGLWRVWASQYGHAQRRRRGGRPLRPSKVAHMRRVAIRDLHRCLGLGPWLEPR